MLLFNIQILKNLTKNQHFQRNLRGLPQRKKEFKFLPSPANEQQKVDEVKLARKELAELTGGLSVEQLTPILEPQKNPNTIQEINDSPQQQGLLPTYNLAAYVNKSELLQQFIQLGVNLSSIEKRKGLANFVLRLQLDDVKPHLLFLKDQGVPEDRFGQFITKNPLIFKVDMDDMQTRINYLKSKCFTPAQMRSILTRNPYWLMFSTKRIDKRLGHFQKEFLLKGSDVRLLASREPRLITYSMDHIRQATLCIREEMGFDKEEIKHLLLRKPRLLMLKSDNLVERFAYAHQEMELPHKMLIQQPEVLTSREFRLRERHEFLKLLGRAQYDPEKDMYISPKSVVEGNNDYFVREVAKSDTETFELFLKTR